MMNDLALFRDLGILYIEVTNKCNLSCEYCYAIQRHLPRNVFTMPLFRKIIDLTADHSQQQHISVIFHGGEPLLAGPTLLEEAMDYAFRQLHQAGKTVDFGIQSNLMLMTDKVVDILKKYGAVVSISIDGPKHIHDKARGGWEKTISHLDRLRDSGIPVNFIAVCSHHNKDHIEDLYLMARDKGFSSLQLNIASSTVGIDPESPIPPLRADDILQVFKECIRCSLKYGILEKKLASMIRYFLSESGNRFGELRCDSPFCHAGTHMLVFTPDGALFPCSPAVPLALAGMNFSLGSIGKDNTGDPVETLLRFHEKGKKYSEECAVCPASKICDFGCPAFDRIDPVTAANHCLATQGLYELFLNMPVNDLKRCTYESDSD